MSSKVEQRTLLHGIANTCRLNQTMREVCFSSLAVSSVCAPNKHSRIISRCAEKARRKIYIMALHFTTHHRSSRNINCLDQYLTEKSPKNELKTWKLR